MCDLIIIHSPTILGLLETKMENPEYIKNEYNFSGLMKVRATGHSGGIVILQHEDQVNISGMRQTFQEFHVMIEVLPNQNPWLLSIIYASPQVVHRNSLGQILN